MAQHPTEEQHRALLDDCRRIAHVLPTSGVLDRGRRAYRPIRFERKLDSLERDPEGLLEYVRGMARRTSEGLDALVEYNRVDLSVEMLILDKDKVYASLFTSEDRAAARAKLAARTSQAEQVIRQREENAQAEQVAVRERVAAIRARLPEDADRLDELARTAEDAEEAIAINTAILAGRPRNTAALNRLGRAYLDLHLVADARRSFEQVLEIEPTNAIAANRLRTIGQKR